MQNPKLHDPNYILGHCSKFGGKASKGLVLSVEKYLFQKKKSCSYHKWLQESNKQLFFFYYFWSLELECKVIDFIII